jgi:hypothetical protein
MSDELTPAAEGTNGVAGSPPQVPPNEPRRKGKKRRPISWATVFVNLCLVAATFYLAHQTKNQADQASRQLEYAKSQAGESEKAARKTLVQASKLTSELHEIADAIVGKETGNLTVPRDIIAIERFDGCEVARNDNETWTLIHANLCYSLAAVARNREHVDYRGILKLQFTREGETWPCSSKERTIPANDTNEIKVEIAKCFFGEKRDKNGDIEFVATFAGRAES